MRDVVRNGYPFLEAIFASLALCRTIHVLDGNSADGSWPALQALRAMVGEDRLILHRASWREDRNAHILASATNQLRERLDAPHGSWLWNFQANEIVTPETAKDMEALLRQHHGVDLFRLPFTTLMGLHYRAYTDFRGRLFRNLPELVSLGDAYDCGFPTSDLRFRPWRLRTFLRLRHRCVSGYLAHPVLRLRAPFPEEYPVKLTTRAELNPWDPWAREEAANASKRLAEVHAGGGSVETFWEGIPFARESDAEPTGPIPRDRRVGSLPVVLHHLRERWRYDPAHSLAALGALPLPAPRAAAASRLP